MTRVRHAYDMLAGEVWPHESAEETELYPSLNQLLGGADPTAPMSRAHAEIAHQIALSPSSLWTYGPVVRSRRRAGWS